MSTPEISIIVPAYQEERNIKPLFEVLHRVLGTENYEVIFIDDGSQDGTSDEIHKLGKSHSNVRGFSFSRNFGHQAALKAGIDHAVGNCVISIDCDLEHPADLLPKMIAIWRNGADVVLTRRKDSLELSFVKRFSSRIFYSILKGLSEVSIEPGTADFRLLDRKVVNVCKGFTESDLFWRGLIPWLGFKTEFLFYEQGQRVHGSTKYSLKKMVQLSLAGITSFSVRPLYFSLYLGLFFASSSMLYLIYALGIRIFTHRSVSGWASVIASVLLMGGVQLFILGVMGIYLAKLFIQSKSRPQYIVSQILPRRQSDQELKKVG